ncbi:DUF397 domain-containing protein [Actinomadura sp. NAK00032]|uniref:DUF397 domain-containing protein n=1 Tax=Actinomadura sp. NAK00032 TaxID=2742128 RepID=UPI00159136E7|nr:DUF397 domain-containing protein [Actinomadura sp. NAK00032]QKW38853.1 DUF397 domain-containing protein [Actinomadura sp. NAK00032]
MVLRKVIWRKVARSHEEGDACVEVASIPDVVFIRDSKDPSGLKILLSHSEFRELAEAIKSL